MHSTVSNVLHNNKICACVCFVWTYCVSYIWFLSINLETSADRLRRTHILPRLYQVRKKSALQWRLPAAMAASQMSTPNPWQRT